MTVDLQNQKTFQIKFIYLLIFDTEGPKIMKFGLKFKMGENLRISFLKHSRL